MPKLRWRSRDNKFVVEIDPKTFSFMTDSCMSAHPNETGGILVGFYSRDGKIAFVTQASKAPDDSNSSRTWFQRGVKNLGKWLSSRWRHEEYYLGEWHYHPDHGPMASEQDKKQLLAISNDRKYACPEPILLIVGGSSNSGWEITAYLAKSPKTFMHLEEIELPQ